MLPVGDFERRSVIQQILSDIGHRSLGGFVEHAGSGGADGTTGGDGGLIDGVTLAAPRSSVFIESGDGGKAINAGGDGGILRNVRGAARILALALNGQITSSIPLTMRDTWGPRWGETTLGKGEPVISLDVVTGSIAITSP